MTIVYNIPIPVTHVSVAASELMFSKTRVIKSLIATFFTFLPVSHGERVEGGCECWTRNAVGQRIVVEERQTRE